MHLQCGVVLPSKRSESAINCRTTRPAALVLVLILALAGSGCGGDDGESAPSATRGNATTTSSGEGGDETTDATSDAGSATTEAEPADGPAVPSPGCEGGTAPTEEVKGRHDLPVGAGEARWYLLTAPAGDGPLPLVVDFHGLSEGAEVHTLMSEMGELGLEEGFVTAFPNGTGTPVAWKASRDSPDLAFVATLLDTIGAERCIDTSRVYATGLSNGAMMTSLLACSMADRFAAFAPVAGLALSDGCDPGRPVPILTFHGTADPILLFNGGIGDLSVVTGGAPPEGGGALPEADLDGEGYPATARAWAEIIGCEEASSDEELTDELIDRTWSCPEGAALEMVIVLGGGHSWPGSEFSKQIESIVGPTTDDIHASEAAWEFFQRYQLPA